MSATELPRREPPVGNIRIGPRVRQEVGDITDLVKSMKDVGLLQPIGISPDGWLVFGARRLAAAKQLGWKHIPAVVIDAPSLLAERDENEIRKEFTASERVEIARRIAAQVGERQGKRTDLEAGTSSQMRQSSATPEPGERTDSFAARVAGFGSKDQMRRAEKVVESGDPELVKAMDTGEVSVSAAAKIADGPKDKQKEALEKARKKARAKKDAKKPGTKKKVKEKTEEVRDLEGLVVPARLRDVFADQAVPREADAVQAWAKAIRPESVQKAILKRATVYPYILSDQVRSALEEAQDALQAAYELIAHNLPYAVCPRCDGMGSTEGDGQCEVCRHGCGYLPKWRLDEVRLEDAT